MIHYKNKVLSAKGKKPILFDVNFQPTEEPQPLAIFCHGYKGFKDWGAWPLVAEHFAKAGFCFVKFNFSHNGGTVENPIDFPDLHAFAENNFSLELSDLERVLEAIENKNEHFPQKIANISLIGHSRGGGIVLIKAEEDPRIHKVVTWASVSDFKPRFQENSAAFKKWKKTGVTFVENSRTKQLLPHHFQFYTDFKENERRYSIHRAVDMLKIPQLIVHGSNDPTVSLAEARAIHAWNPQSELAIIEGADHVFGAQHPWTTVTLPAPLRNVCEITVQFLK